MLKRTWAITAGALAVLAASGLAHAQWSPSAPTRLVAANSAAPDVPSWVVAQARDIAVRASQAGPDDTGWPSSVRSVSIVVMSGRQFDTVRGISGAIPAENHLYVAVLVGEFPNERPALSGNSSATDTNDRVVWVALDPEWKQPRGFVASPDPIGLPAGSEPVVLYSR